MRRRFRRPKKEVKVEVRYRANERIRVPRVVVIDGQGEHLGEMRTDEAIEKAQSLGYDLVEVAPNAKPPVCKMLDYGKFQYQQAKQQQQSKSKQKKIDTKGIRIGLRTDAHDLNFKKTQTEKFLNKGQKVKVEIFLRGREKAHRDLAKENLKAFIDTIELPFKVEEEIKSFPGGFNIIIAPE